ncbi:ABC transporter ATP-binding protein [Imhoffiella purpurea]|uniref:YbbL ABC transporter ATP-binding protein n=1 Tax=Imhoffiella purpurea TaxID=1249627 RepID=W9VCB2_9GAMM|nr:ATP-binding cassette domain-containing protein [Imhoffiella purpurea]EXJ17084.1 YbbL ABC transporter ATP-binding protein [Imhoffiella purpurea]
MASLRLSGLRHRLLEPVELSLESGELAFVSGPSGSGKSLLLRAIADLDPHEGEAWIGDQARSSMPAPVWRRRVGFLPAESFWWADRVGEHLPPAEPALKDWLERLGFGPETLDWSIARLSTGERQRLSLVRLLAQRPEVLLLDEPTANLDPNNRDRVESLIEGYRQDASASLLWVSHDPDQRRRLDGRSLLIRDGRLEPESWA